jgi:hypothetical protein
MDLLPERTLHLPEMTMTSGVENVPLHMAKRLLQRRSLSLDGMVGYLG